LRTHVLCHRRHCDSPTSPSIVFCQRVGRSPAAASGPRPTRSTPCSPSATRCCFIRCRPPARPGASTRAWASSTQYHPGRDSLACDLMEPFRVPAVDRLVLRRLGLKRDNAQEFLHQEGDFSVRLIEEALRRWATDLERHLHAADEDRPSLQVPIVERVGDLVDALPNLERPVPRYARRSRIRGVGGGVPASGRPGLRPVRRVAATAGMTGKGSPSTSQKWLSERQVSADCPTT
jgi:hypothetical protein